MAEREKHSIYELRKYANRKLYNTATTKYVSMLEVGDLICGDKNATVHVTDDRTGADLTVETLSRALYERVKARTPGSDVPPVRDLEQMLRKVSRRLS